MSRLQRWTVAVARALLLALFLQAGSIAAAGAEEPVPQPGQGESKPKPDLTPAKGFKLYEGDKGALTFSLHVYPLPESTGARRHVYGLQQEAGRTTTACLRVVGRPPMPAPSATCTRGTWPFWLKQDNRTIADEYFRGSYTSGIWAWGDVADRLHYKAMLGNNLSQLGVDAGQLDAGMNTYSGVLWWTTGDFGA